MKPASTDIHGQLAAIRDTIVGCERCPRLRTYCQQIAHDKRRAYRDDTYWGRPVPGFGDPFARLLLVGLAPAAHGANRTGRVFTGDGNGGSGDFLMTALNRTGFASLPTSSRIDDGLALYDAYIVMAVRCAPPDNAPEPEEITRCLDHLDAEVAELPRAQVVVALGKIAFDVWLRLLKRRGATIGSPRPLVPTLRVRTAAAVIRWWHPSVSVDAATHRTRSCRARRRPARAGAQQPLRPDDRGNA